MKILKFLLLYISIAHFNYTYANFFVNDNKIDFNSITVKPIIKNKSKKIKKEKAASKISYSFKHYKSGRVSFEKFRDILISHNFPSDKIGTMWCIAKHESNFNSLAYNYNNNKTFDVGLFQINQIWKKWCGMKDKELLDVKNNTKCALVVLKKQGLTAWVTYNKFCRGV